MYYDQSEYKNPEPRSKSTLVISIKPKGKYSINVADILLSCTLQINTLTKFRIFPRFQCPLSIDVGVEVTSEVRASAMLLLAVKEN